VLRMWAEKIIVRGRGHCRGRIERLSAMQQGIADFEAKTTLREYDADGLDTTWETLMIERLLRAALPQSGVLPALHPSAEGREQPPRRDGRAPRVNIVVHW